jgi:hypothetical protein
MVQYIIVPHKRHRAEGERHVGSYPDVATRYRAIIKKGGIPYLHTERDFPFKMFDANDTRGEEWCA